MRNLDVCSSCGAQIKLDEDVKARTCPKCGGMMLIQPDNPFRPDAVAAAMIKVEAIEDLLADQPNLRHAVLWFLEERWLAPAGHHVTLKLGKMIYDNKAHCCICGEDCGKTAGGVALELRDRWRNSDILVNICARHMGEALWGCELDIHKHRTPRLGPA